MPTTKKAISPADFRNPVPQRVLRLSKEIIAKSRPNSRSLCAVAQCLRLDHGAKSVQVTAERITYTAPGKMFNGTACMMRYSHPTPSGAALRLVDFDKTGKMEPYTFRLSDNDGCFAVPARTYPNRKGRGPTKKRRVKQQGESAVHCVRRYHGLKVVEVRVAA